jgi:hypothetical protein
MNWRHLSRQAEALVGLMPVDTHWQYRGLQVVRLENELISIDILPELGGKIYNFIHLPSDRNLLWHNPRILPARQQCGARFDDVWSGGWDELIPNDIPTPVIGNEMLPDHGEVWSQPSEWQVVKSSESKTTVRLVNHGHVLPTAFEKTISLQRGDPFCTVQYRLTNLGRQPVDFLWNIHPAMAISPTTRLDLRARRGIVEKWGTDHFEGGSEYDWPYAIDRSGKRVDLRQVHPPESALADHHYLPDVLEGWYAVTDTQARVGFGLVFPTSVFPHLWLFRTFGGWRKLYTLILEASNGYPNDLAIARQTGRCGHLEPSQTIEAEVKAIAYSGHAAVERIEPDGTVIGGKT